MVLLSVRGGIKTRGGDRKYEGSAETLNSLSLVTLAACNSATIIRIHANENEILFFLWGRNDARGL